MRYSFHGKVRATGQQVDGFVEAENASQAIDRLADKGIIGVYSVRPEPKIPKHSVILAGEPEPEEPPRRERPRLERPASRGSKPIPAVAAPVAPPQPQLPAPQPAGPAPTEATMTLLVEKLSALLIQVEKVLARPQQVIYTSGGPARSGGGNVKKSSRIPSEMQNNTLRDIFQTNLDLRQSLEKLANAVAPAVPRTNGAANGESSKTARETVPNGSDLVDAQPAA